MSMKTTMSLFLGVCLMAGTAMASPVSWGTNITIPDNTADATFGGGPYGVAREDNETEAGTVSSQKWDLEGMFLNTGNSEFSMVGGWNFKGSVDGYASGDVFIAVGTAPAYGNPGFAGTFMNQWGYSYVLDMDWANNTYTIWVDGVTDVTVSNAAFVANYGANPILRTGGGTQLLPNQTFSFAYESALSDAYTGFVGDVNNVPSHYRVSMDLSWLATILGNDPANPIPVWFHFTQTCGNDNLMGYIPDTWDPVPTPVVPEPATMSLLGIGIAGLITLQMRRKAARA